MPIYSSDSDDERNSKGAKLFNLQRPLHQILGGGRVADMILWRNRNLSAAILTGFTVIWILFEVVEYHFLTLVCHLSIIAMIGIFLWSNGAALFDRDPPRVPDLILSEHAFTEAALTFHHKLSWFVDNILGIARGKDLKLFLLAITTLWILSVIGSYCDSLSLIYICYLCVQILPVLYERYEHEVDRLATTGSRDLKKLFRKLDSKVLHKIPRGPVKEKKRK